MLAALRGDAVEVKVGAYRCRSAPPSAFVLGLQDCRRLRYASLPMRVFRVHSLWLELALTAAFWGAIAAAPTVCSALDAEIDTLGPDKALHYTVSVGLTLGASLVCDVIGLDEPITLPLSIGFAVAMGVGKETFDAMRGTGFSAADLTWDLLGIATGVLLRVLIRALFEPDEHASDERLRTRPQSQAHQSHQSQVALHFFLTK